jgi:hypothetical protein
MNIAMAKEALDKIIRKARVHLYKPIQIAEILHRDRVKRDVSLDDLETYRTLSRHWRDPICKRLLGRTSTSSARYQDDLFNENAVPPLALVELGEVNRHLDGVVEAYIYRKVEKRHAQLASAVNYARDMDRDNFDLEEFVGMFWNEPGLRRSIDKVYEVIVYALFQVLVERMEVFVSVRINEDRIDLLREFDDFAKMVLLIDAKTPTFETRASFHRVGVTNAADRGLDMWANYGPAVQIKHLSLSIDQAKSIVSTVTADRIIIVCIDSERDTIVSLLTQIGWKARIQSVITLEDLKSWYEKALRGVYGSELGDRLLELVNAELGAEFPACANNGISSFMEERGYSLLEDVAWWE